MDCFECPICLQYFKDPKVISCGHTFCKSCLQNLQPNQLSCPLCRRTFESVDSLSSNFVLLKWMNEMKDKDQLTKQIVPNCENCDSKPAVVWCESCPPTGLFFCKDCNTQIHNFKATKTHIRRSLKEKSKMPTFTKCKSHFKDNEVYCTDCQSLICMICMIDFHKLHNVQSISKCAEEKRAELKACLNSLQDMALITKEQELMVAIERDKTKKNWMEEQIKILDMQIIQNEGSLQQISIQKERIKVAEIVLINSIEEIRDLDLLERSKIEIMKMQILDVLQEVYPTDYSSEQTAVVRSAQKVSVKTALKGVPAKKAQTAYEDFFTTESETIKAPAKVAPAKKAPAKTQIVYKDFFTTELEPEKKAPAKKAPAKKE